MNDNLFPSNPEEFEEYAAFVQNGGNSVFETDEYHEEMQRLADLAEASAPDPRPEDFYYEDDPRAYAH